MELTIEDIQNKMIELGFDKKLNDIMNHQTWEEDGRKYSVWKIQINGHTIYTGDGGRELFLKVLKEKLNHEPIN